MEKLKIGYFADGIWGHNTFKKLLADETIEIVFVMVRYDVRDTILMDMAKQHNIPILLHPNVNSEEFLNLVTEYEADLFVSMSFNQIFKKQFIETARLGTINCHAGKLPFYRGRNILNWALINDEKEFGITVHYVDTGIDTGDIILQRTYPISDEDNYGTLLERAHVECANILYDAVKQIQDGTAERKKQNDIDAVGMYCGMRQAGDEILNWNQSSREIFNFVRAICKPGPQATGYVGDEEIKINKIREVKGAHIYKGICGQVIGKTNEGVYVKTKDSMVEIVEYTGKRLKVGDRFTIC